MATKVPAPKITDLVTTVDSETFDTAVGPMVWGSVDLSYVSDGLEPRVTIRVPIPAYDAQSDEQRREEVLRRARRLIDHACVSLGPGAEPTMDEIVEGLAEELGMANPKPSPKVR